MSFDGIEEEQFCPICIEPMDATDLAVNYCQCGYRLCLWCWNQLMENALKDNIPGRCPNCRTEYDKDKITMSSVDPDFVQGEAKKKKKDDKKKGAVCGAKARKDLAQVRVVQRNLVYAVGLALNICREEILSEKQFFGQYGKIKKISVNRSSPGAGQASKAGPSGSAYVTYVRAEDAVRCIEAIDGIVWEGRTIKACHGTTKYCNAFLRGATCNNPDCLYLHDVADDLDSFSKEDVLSSALAGNTGNSKFYNMVHPTAHRGAAGALAATTAGPSTSLVPLKATGGSAAPQQALPPAVGAKGTHGQASSAIAIPVVQRKPAPGNAWGLAENPSPVGSWGTPRLAGGALKDMEWPSLAVAAQAEAEKEKSGVLDTDEARATACAAMPVPKADIANGEMTVAEAVKAALVGQQRAGNPPGGQGKAVKAIALPLKTTKAKSLATSPAPGSAPSGGVLNFKARLLHDKENTKAVEDNGCEGIGGETGRDAVCIDESLVVPDRVEISVSQNGLSAPGVPGTKPQIVVEKVKKAEAKVKQAGKKGQKVEKVNGGLKTALDRKATGRESETGRDSDAGGKSAVSSAKAGEDVAAADPPMTRGNSMVAPAVTSGAAGLPGGPVPPVDPPVHFPQASSTPALQTAAAGSTAPAPLSTPEVPLPMPVTTAAALLPPSIPPLAALQPLMKQGGVKKPPPGFEEVTIKKKAPPPGFEDVTVVKPPGFPLPTHCPDLLDPVLAIAQSVKANRVASGPLSINGLPVVLGSIAGEVQPLPPHQSSCSSMDELSQGPGLASGTPSQQSEVGDGSNLDGGRHGETYKNHTRKGSILDPPIDMMLAPDPVVPQPLLHAVAPVQSTMGPQSDLPTNLPGHPQANGTHLPPGHAPEGHPPGHWGTPWDLNSILTNPAFLPDNTFFNNGSAAEAVLHDPAVRRLVAAGPRGESRFRFARQQPTSPQATMGPAAYPGAHQFGEVPTQQATGLQMPSMGPAHSQAQALPHWLPHAPHQQYASVSPLVTNHAVGTSPQDTVSVLKSVFPGVQVRAAPGYQPVTSMAHGVPYHTPQSGAPYINPLGAAAHTEQGYTQEAARLLATQSGQQASQTRPAKVNLGHTLLQQLQRGAGQNKTGAVLQLGADAAYRQATVHMPTAAPSEATSGVNAPHLWDGLRLGAYDPLHLAEGVPKATTRGPPPGFSAPYAAVQMSTMGPPGFADLHMTAQPGAPLNRAV